MSSRVGGKEESIGARRLERVPSLTESERAFLTDAIFNGEDTTSHVVSSTFKRCGHRCDGLGGFSSEEMAKLLGPSPESIVSVLSRTNAEYQPLNRANELKQIVSLPLRTLGVGFDVMSPICYLARSKGEDVYELIFGFSDQLLLVHVVEGSAVATDILVTSHRLQKLQHLDPFRILAVYPNSIGVIIMSENEQKLTAQPSCWSTQSDELLCDIAVQNGVSHTSLLACVSSAGHLTIIDAAEMKPVTKQRFAFGRNVTANIKWNAWDPVQLAYTTSIGSFGIFDIRDPSSCLCEVGFQNVDCHCFISDNCVLLARSGGLIHFLDTRYATRALLEFRAPSVGPVRDLSSGHHGRLVQMTGYSGKASLWEVGFSTYEAAQMAHHKLLGHVQPSKAENQINNVAWISPQHELLSTLDNEGFLSVIDPVVD